MTLSRRRFLAGSLASWAACRGAQRLAWGQGQREFKVALSENSLRRRLKDKSVDHLDFAEIARNEFDIEAVEYVSSYFSARLDEEGFLPEMNKRAAEHGVRQVRIELDDQGDLAEPDPEKRRQVVQNHRRWIDAAKTLGCQAVCVRIGKRDDAAEAFAGAKESLAEIAGYGEEQRIMVLVANDGPPTCRPAWLVELIEAVGGTRLGAQPDFESYEEIDRYTGMQRLLPYAKGISATARTFDEAGNEMETDYFRMMKIVLDGGYRGHVSIDYRGETLDEYEGVRAAKALLDRVREQMV